MLALLLECCHSVLCIFSTCNVRRSNFTSHQERNLSRLESRPTLPTVTYGPGKLMLANRHILLSSCRRFQTAKTSFMITKRLGIHTKRFFVQGIPIIATSAVVLGIAGTVLYVDYQDSPRATLASYPVHILSTFPLRYISRLFGSFNALDIPVPLRAPLFSLYATIFGADIKEAKYSNYTHYKNLQEFFFRELKPGARPIDPTPWITSPVDGKVLICGKVESNRVEQVKGVTYDLDLFLGPPLAPPPVPLFPRILDINSDKSLLNQDISDVADDDKEVLAV